MKLTHEAWVMSWRLCGTGLSQQLLKQQQSQCGHLWQDCELKSCHLALRFFLFYAKAASDASDNGPEEKYPNTTMRLTPNYRHPTRRREILKSMKHYDTE
jgi:hypothetical protein